MLIRHPGGQYSFLEGIGPYSSGVIAEEGHEIVQVTARDWNPWRAGFERIEAFLRARNLPRKSLCAIQLRCPRPYPFGGFIRFNEEYIALLEDWGLLVGSHNPIARTNVSPVADAPEEPALFAFSYVTPREGPRRPSFVVAGGGELRGGALEGDAIVRRGEVSPAAMSEKAQYVMEVMSARLDGLGTSWAAATRANIYTPHPIDELLKDVVLPGMGAARHHGVHWYPARPPVEEVEFEMDVRGIEEELCVQL